MLILVKCHEYEVSQQKAILLFMQDRVIYILVYMYMLQLHEHFRDYQLISGNTSVVRELQIMFLKHRQITSQIYTLFFTSTVLRLVDLFLRKILFVQWNNNELV